MDAQFIYQANIYYGIFAPATMQEEILDIISKSEKFAGLAAEDGELDIEGTIIFTSFNSDEESPSTWFIAADELTRQGDTFGTPTEAHVNVDPRVLTTLEQTYTLEIKLIGEIRELLSRGLSSKRFKSIETGWKVLTCAWDESN